MKTSNWFLKAKEIETKHLYVSPAKGHVPIVMANGKHYAVEELILSDDGELLWVLCSRHAKKTPIMASFTPSELKLMELGYSDCPDLALLIRKKAVFSIKKDNSIDVED